MTLSTSQKTIEQLLTGNRQYQIPDFQRPYVWEEQQAIALVNDLLDAWRMNDGDYFLGSIVLVDHPGGDNVDIIDGQQRLTTLCILVALLRHLAGTDAGLHAEIGQLLSIPESRIKGLDENLGYPSARATATSSTRFLSETTLTHSLMSTRTA